MERKVNIKIKIILLCILLVILACLLADRMRTDDKEEEWNEAYIGISEVKSELSFSVYTSEEWEEYFAVYHKEYLTWEMLSQLLKKLGVSEEIVIEKKYGKRAVSRDDWNVVYEQILDYLDMEKKVEQKRILILGKEPAKNGTILVTNEGDFYTPLKEEWFLVWQAYEIYHCEETCVGVKGVCQEETELLNTYLKEKTGDKITFLYSGAVYEKEVSEIETEFSLGVCDIVFAKGKVTTIRMKPDHIEGKLLSYDSNFIEIENYGKIEHQGKLPVYQTYGEISEKSISDIVLGNMKLEYITAKDKIGAILIREPAQIQDIRVLLLGEDGSNFRKDIYLKCNTPVFLKCGDQETEIGAEEIVHVPDYIKENDGNTFIMLPGEGGVIFVCDENGTIITNGYAGSMEVREYEQGYTLVNQLPFEQYLYAVVPSEMPSNFYAEALKAQAICARSYAYKQLLRADLAEYGAHINDSTSYQVYNKTSETKESIEAVEATRGKVLTYKGDVIEAYYFSTSMGYTDTLEVWNMDETDTYGYLHKFCLNKSEYDGNLSEESDFLEYIKAQETGYDSDIKYYRWFAVADLTSKTEDVDCILENRYSISKENVLYYGLDGVTLTDPGMEKGKLIGISVEKRSTSGSILQLKLQYEKGIVRVKTEYNIRKVLGCLVEKIVYADGSESENITMLPSAFCAITMQEDGKIVFSGGGYGHGIGMSQNGANGMAKAGMTCEEILAAFYQDVELTIVNE